MRTSAINWGVQDTSAYVDAHSLPSYAFCDDAFTGGRGFADGSYLIPHPREVFYNTRRGQSVYKNYFKPVVRAMVDPVFAENATRETGSEMVQEFLDDADGGGTDLAQIVRRACTMGRALGSCFLVVENAPTGPDTVAQAIEQRAFPYVYCRKPQDVIAITPTRTGGLVAVTFFDHTERNPDGKDVTYHRRWDSQTWQLLRVVEREEGTGTYKYLVVEEGTHGLGQIPVIPVYQFADDRRVTTKVPDAPLIDLARLNFALYQKESEIRNMELNQSFSLLYLQDGGKDIVVGTNNYIRVSETATMAPGFASPDAAHMVNLVNNAQALREDIYRIASQNGVIGVKAEASGVSKEWDFRAEEAILKGTALAAAEIEEKIIDIFVAYTGQGADYTVQYPGNFSPSYDSDRITLDLSILDKLPPEAVAREVWKDLVNRLWKNDPEKLDEVNAELDTTSPATTPPLTDETPGTDEGAAP